MLISCCTPLLESSQSAQNAHINNGIITGQNWENQHATLIFSILFSVLFCIMWICQRSLSLFLLTPTGEAVYRSNSVDRPFSRSLLLLQHVCNPALASHPWTLTIVFSGGKLDWSWVCVGAPNQCATVTLVPLWAYSLSFQVRWEDQYCSHVCVLNVKLEPAATYISVKISKQDIVC